MKISNATSKYGTLCKLIGFKMLCSLQNKVSFNMKDKAEFLLVTHRPFKIFYSHKIDVNEATNISAIDFCFFFYNIHSSSHIKILHRQYNRREQKHDD